MSLVKRFIGLFRWRILGGYFSRAPISRLKAEFHQPLLCALIYQLLLRRHLTDYSGRSLRLFAAHLFASGGIGRLGSLVSTFYGFW